MAWREKTSRVPRVSAAAAAAASLVLSSCSPEPGQDLPKCAASDPAYKAADDLLFQGNRALESRRYRSASSRYGKAIEALGDRYLGETERDDTAGRIALADFHEIRGADGEAAALRREVIERRMDQYRRAHRCSK